MEERLELLYDSLSRVVEFTKVADAKAAPVLFLHVGLAGILAALFEPLFEILKEEPWNVERAGVLTALALYMAFTIVAATFAARVYIPIVPRSGKSLIYFEDIISISFERFAEQYQQLDPHSVEEQLMDQVYRVSQIASTKMHRVRAAFLLTGPAGLLWLLLIGWVNI